jgi:hypothetical protein
MRDAGVTLGLARDVADVADDYIRREVTRGLTNEGVCGGTGA